MRILIVEDNDDIVRSVKTHLESECYAVDTENDGERGLYLARTNDYDLIILDNVLPGMEGSEICRTLRAKGGTVPILMLSVQSESDRKAAIIEDGADDYLTKPFSLRELSARVKALLRRPHGRESKSLTANGFTLDRKTYAVYCGADQIYLTPKEFSLLEYFMKNPGVVLTRGMILEHVWDGTADPFTKSIDIHVMNLRRKLTADTRTAFIKTVPGRGYKIDLI